MRRRAEGQKEREVARERILTEADYKAIVDTAPRWLQRMMIAANETAIDQGVLLKLTWDCVKDGLIVVKGGRAKTGARQAVGVSPALEGVLDELRAEFRRIPNTDRRVFTKGGKPIQKPTLRHAFEKAVGDAKVRDFQFRDFRHCAHQMGRGRVAVRIGELGIGHKLRGISGRYIDLSDDRSRRLSENVPSCPREITAPWEVVSEAMEVIKKVGARSGI